RQTLALGSALTLVFAGGRLRMANGEGQNLPEGDAYAPWDLWNDPGVRHTPLALVAAAILAANPHDTQPWLFRIGDDAIEVLADLSRNLARWTPLCARCIWALAARSRTCWSPRDRMAMTPRSQWWRAHSRTLPNDAVLLPRPRS